MKKTLLIIISLLILPLFSSAETIYLKSGKIIDGKIEQMTNTEVTVLRSDYTVDIYRIDEIEGISGLDEDKEEFYRKISSPEYQQPSQSFSPGYPNSGHSESDLSQKEPSFVRILNLLEVILLPIIIALVFLYRYYSENKIPIGVAFVVGLILHHGLGFLVSVFFIRRMIEGAAGGVFAFIFLLAGLFFSYLGIELYRLQNWARSFLLGSTAIVGIIVIALEVVKGNSTLALVSGGIFAIIFGIFYLCLNKDYFS